MYLDEQENAIAQESEKLVKEFLLEHSPVDDAV